MRALLETLQQGVTVRLLFLNAAYLAIGIALLDQLGMTRQLRSLIELAGVAYLAGMSVAGIISADLALVGRLPAALVIELAGMFALGWTIVRMGARWQRHEAPREPAGPSGARAFLPSALVAVALLQVLHALPTALVKPLLYKEWDSWAIWSLKGRALAELGSAKGQVFLSRAYLPSHLDYPILQPTWSALAGSAVGGWSVPAMRMQLVLLACAGLWAVVGLSRSWFVAIALAGGTIAISSQAWFLDQLLTGYADVPVALLAAVTLVALAEYARARDRNLLVLAMIFGGAAGLIKNEGTLAVVAAFCGIGLQIALTRRWSALRSLGWCALGTLALWAPWRLFVALHGLPSNDFRLGDALHPSILRERLDRLWPATSAVWDHIEPRAIAAPLALLLAALIAASLLRRWTEVAGVLCWLALSFAGLVVVYWISLDSLQYQLDTSVDRVTTAILLGATLWSALLAGRIVEELLDPSAPGLAQRLRELGGPSTPQTDPTAPTRPT